MQARDTEGQSGEERNLVDANVIDSIPKFLEDRDPLVQRHPHQSLACLFALEHGQLEGVELPKVNVDLLEVVATKLTQFAHKKFKGRRQLVLDVYTYKQVLSLSVA